MASGRQTIKQRIALEGGKEIEQQLKELGEVGEKAFEQIRKAAVKADLAKFGNSLGTFGKDLATVGRRAMLAFSAIATGATAAGAAMFGLAKSAGDAADQVGKAAQKTGLQVEAFQKLAHAAEMSDVGPEQFVAGMSRLNMAIADAAEQAAKASQKIGSASKDAGRNITQHLGYSVETFDDIGVRVTRFGGDVEKGAQKAKQGSEGVAAAFIKLGVRIKDANGKLRTNQEILFDLADAFSRLPDGAEKSALVMEIFGRSGAELLPFLNEGADGIKKLGDRFAELGGVFSEEQTAIGDALGDALDEVGTAISGLQKQFGILFAPAITNAAEQFTEFLVKNRALILKFGNAVAQYGIRMMNDLINALTGNDAAVSQPWILKWRDAIVQFGTDTRAVIETIIIPLFQAVRDAAKLTADAINAVFGTDISAGQLIIGAALLKLLGVFKLIRSGAELLVAGIRLIGSAVAFAFSGGVISALSKFWSILVRGAAAFVSLIASLVGWPGLIVAGVIAAGVAIVAFWDEIKAGAAATWNFVTGLFSAATFAAIWDGMKAGAQAAWDGIKAGFDLAAQGISATFNGIVSVADLAWQGIVAGATGLVDLLTPIWAGIQTAGSAVWSGISGSASTAWTAITQGATAIFDTVAGIFSAGADRVGQAFSAVADLVSSIWTGATDGIAAAAQAITDAIARASEIAGDVAGAEEIAAALVKPFQDASAAIDKIFSEIAAFASRGFNSVMSEVRKIASEIDRMIASIISALRRAAAEAARLRAQAQSGDGAERRAGGGYIRGPGTGTSDSIPAWLSNGEFVIRAAAVRKFGAGFFAALNSLRMPQGFNMGGMVRGFQQSMSSLSMPPLRFADGGLVAAPAGSSGRPVTLNIGGEVFDMMADNHVVDRLQRFATTKGLRSTGRKPGWI